MEVMLYAKIIAHLRLHPRFYAALVLGLAATLATRGFSWPFRLAAITDTFFIVFLVASTLSFGESAAELRERAEFEDIGIFLVVLIVLAAVGTALVSIVIIIRHSHGQITGPILVALAAAPLGWAMLHVIAAFHYANLYYAGSKRPDWEPPLQFPCTRMPSAWDFLYYAFVIGMTAQTSDVQITDTQMRRATLGHGIVSFVFNTVLIAMSVNAVLNLAG